MKWDGKSEIREPFAMNYQHYLNNPMSHHMYQPWPNKPIFQKKGFKGFTSAPKPEDVIFERPKKTKRDIPLEVLKEMMGVPI